MPSLIVVSKAQLETMQHLRRLGLTSFQVGLYCGLKVKTAGRLLGPARCRGRPDNRLGREGPTTAKASRRVRTSDIGWVAGFLEGEGSFQRQSVVSAVQVNREPLERLEQLLGGRIWLRKTHGARQPTYQWNVSGPRARGVMLTIFSLMSAKRQRQVHRAMRRS